MTPLITMALELIERKKCSSAMFLLSGGKIGCELGTNIELDMSQAMKIMVGGMVGDLFCPDVDIDAFKKQCRAPLYPNKWNVWRLYRTTRDNVSDAEIVETALAVFRHWFSTSIYDEERHGKFFYPKVTIVPNENQANPWKTPPVTNRQACAQIIMLASSSTTPGYRTVYVRFVHRGQQTDMPWPVHKQQVMNSWCPIEADWILDTVFAPYTDEPVPAEENDPTFPPGLVPDVPDLPDLPDLPFGTKIGIGIVLAGVGAIIGLAILRATG